MIGTKRLIIPNKELQDKVDPRYRHDMETIERFINGLTLPPPAAASIWEEVAVPTGATDWTVPAGSGTWDFSVPGEITQTTDNGAVTANNPVIFSNVDVPGLAWALQATVSITTPLTGNPVSWFGAGFNEAVYDNFQAEAINDLAVGFSTDPANEIYPAAQGNEIPGSDGVFGKTIVTVPFTHTVKAINFSGSMVLYMDGNLEQRASNGGGSLYDVHPDPNTTWRFSLLAQQVVAGVFKTAVITFSNLRAWRVPLPSFIP